MTKTLVVIESHEQTIIRRSRRTISSNELLIATAPGTLARPLVRTTAEEITPAVQEKRNSLGVRLKTFARKRVMARLTRRLKIKPNERKTKQP